MKNFLKVAILTILMLGLTTAKAAKKVEVTVDQTLNLIHISLESVSIGERLVIRDFEGFALFKKTFREIADFKKSFSLKGKDDGMYFVEVENDIQIQITPVLKNDLGVTLIKKAVKFMTKPVYEKKGDVFSVTVDNTKKYDVTISIYSDSGIKISSEENIQDAAIHRSYNTNDLPKGIYTLSVTQGQDTFSESFDVN